MDLFYVNRDTCNHQSSYYFSWKTESQVLLSSHPPVRMAGFNVAALCLMIFLSFEGELYQNQGDSDKLPDQNSYVYYD